ncbi:Solute carrier family 35 member F3 [Tupaia chinensis]|uniref:Solute carrier family 35 member F3 n=1 Tax=Tupaia chinensis TaxID=246437 RepID=L9KZL6_TUPCH|nr:Solute carrier family 35 member F3 [Tupaia chinensis]
MHEACVGTSLRGSVAAPDMVPAGLHERAVQVSVRAVCRVGLCVSTVSAAKCGFEKEPLAWAVASCRTDACAAGDRRSEEPAFGVRARSADTRAGSRECCRFFGDNGLTLKVFFTKAAPFGVLWTLTNYLYLHAIKKVNTTDVSVLFCCNKAFVFLLSWIVLRDRFMGVRIVAAILAIAGIVMMTYADGFHSPSVIGVLFKLLLGSAKFGEAALFLSILGVFNVLFISCIPVTLYFTKVEYWSPFDNIPWGNLCGFSVLLLTFNVVLNFGIAVTYPTLMSLGIVLSVPVNAVVDHYTSEIVFNGVRVIAIIIIGLGFLLLLLPEEWDVWLIQLLTRLKVRKKEEAAEGGADSGLGPQSRPHRARPSFAR